MVLLHLTVDWDHCCSILFIILYTVNRDQWGTVLASPGRVVDLLCFNLIALTPVQ